jgi:ATP synthase protein I
VPFLLRLFQSKAVRTVLRWQLAATAFLAAVSLPWFGAQGAFSAALGGSINMVAGIAYFALAGLGREASARNAIRRMIRAEAGKIMIIVGALWLAYSAYQGLVFVPFFAAFVVTALAAGASLLAGDDAAAARR